VVQRGSARAIAIPALCVVEFRLVGGSFDLSVSVRAAFDLRTQSMLWSGAFVLYAVLCAAALASLWRYDSPLLLGEGPGVRAEQDSGQRSVVGGQDQNLPISNSFALRQRPRLARPFPLAGAAGLRIADASGGDEPYLPETWRRFFSVGDAVEPLLAFLHRKFRARALVHTPFLGGRFSCSP